MVAVSAGAAAITPAPINAAVAVAGAGDGNHGELHLRNLTTRQPIPIRSLSPIQQKSARWFEPRKPRQLGAVYERGAARPALAAELLGIRQVQWWQRSDHPRDSSMSASSGLPGQARAMRVGGYHAALGHTVEAVTEPVALAPTATGKACGPRTVPPRWFSGSGQ